MPFRFVLKFNGGKCMKKGTYKLRDYIVSVAFIAVFIYSIFIEKYISDNVNKNIISLISIFIILIILTAIFRDFKDKKYKTRLLIVLIDIVNLTLVSILILIFIYKDINDYLGMCLIAIILLNILAFLRRYLQNNKFLKV